MDNRRPGSGHQLQFLIRHVHHMSQHGAFIQQPHIAGIAHGAPSSVQGTALLHFPGGFGQMDMQHHIQFLRQLHGTPEHFVTGSVHAVRHQGHLHPAAAGKAFRLLPVQGFRTIPPPVCRRGKSKNDFPANTAHSHAFRFLEDIGLQQVGIYKRRGARPHHFIHAQPGPQGDDFIRQPGFHRENMPGQPFHQRQVIRKTAQKGHGDMRMGINQPRHQQRIPQIPANGGRPPGFQFCGASRFQNFPVPNGDGRISGSAGLFRSAQHAESGHQQITRLLFHGAECTPPGAFWQLHLPGFEDFASI